MLPSNFVWENVSVPIVNLQKIKAKWNHQNVDGRWFYIRAKGKKKAGKNGLGWHNEKRLVGKCVSVLGVEEVITDECNHWMIWGQPSEEKFWSYDIVCIDLRPIWVVPCFEPRGRNGFCKMVSIEEKIQRHGDRTRIENSLKTFRMTSDTSL